MVRSAPISYKTPAASVAWWSTDLSGIGFSILATHGLTVSLRYQVDSCTDQYLSEASFTHLSLAPDVFQHKLLYPVFYGHIFPISFPISLDDANEKAQIHSCKQKVKGSVSYGKLFLKEHLEKYTWGLTDSQGWVLLKIKITHVKQ